MTAPTDALRTLDVDALAEEIRRVDGSHSLGAGALAEALAPYIASLATPAGSASGEEPFRNMPDGATFEQYRDKLAVGGLTAVDQMAFDNMLHDNLEALQAEVARLREDVATATRMHAITREHLEAAEAEAARLREDAARWRYMRMRLTSDDGPSIEMAHAMLEGNADTLDREVDAAIQGSANGQG